VKKLMVLLLVTFSLNVFAEVSPHIENFQKTLIKKRAKVNEGFVDWKTKPVAYKMYWKSILELNWWARKKVRRLVRSEQRKKKKRKSVKDDLKVLIGIQKLIHSGSYWLATGIRRQHTDGVIRDADDIYTYAPGVEKYVYNDKKQHKTSYTKWMSIKQLR
jgi:hypothetical protein